MRRTLLLAIFFLPALRVDAQSTCPPLVAPTPDPAKLLFTRLDETDSFGALVSESARRDLPISFLATGQQIPDDLEPATSERLAQLVLGSAALAARSAGAAA